MIRTSIYLTEAEKVGLGAIAEAEGSTRSDIVRSIVDRALHLDDDAEMDELLAELAPDLARLARELVVDVTDLRID